MRLILPTRYRISILAGCPPTGTGHSLLIEKYRALAVKEEESESEVKEQMILRLTRNVIFFFEIVYSNCFR